MPREKKVRGAGREEVWNSNGKVTYIVIRALANGLKNEDKSFCILQVMAKP